MAQQPPIEIRFPDDPTVPDIYADGAGMQAGPFGFALIFTRSGNDPVAPVPVAVVRFSPQQAFVLSRQLTRGVRLYQEQIGSITLPEAFLQALGLDEA